MPQLRLDDALKKAKLTRYQFAKLCKKDYQSTRVWYEPDYDPRWSTICLWLRVLKIKIGRLAKED